ncbi:DUF6283 family protein [Nonomuraea sp. NPDC046570]|uniref:DUF6283 family protein n=1 Tax=Nonomuraea sp. NPDC046570 TaxID=3155255 RepID=UPI0033EF869E
MEGEPDHQRAPCARCPWRVDTPVGVFPAQVFRDSAATTYDLAVAPFGCHASDPNRPLTCAGFLLLVLLVTSSSVCSSVSTALGD